ncbi:MAG: zinc ABC transporter substrate-binding protein [Pirellulaceae bacterium]|nr:zinc ABC transporter substrate-binding protein [Pirellulaceae bacterium]
MNRCSTRYFTPRHGDRSLLLWLLLLWPLLASCLLLATCLLPAGCSPSGQPATTAGRTADGPPRVYVVNYPLRYFAERIGGESVRVEFPAPSDEDPAYWSPAAEQVAAFQQADLILLNGAGYAGWIRKVSLPEARLCDTSAAFADRLIEIQDAVTHTHGPGGEHTHTGTAFTTWLDPQQAELQAQAVADRLSLLLPDKKEQFQQRVEDLRRELAELDQQLAELFAAQPQEPVIFSHPVYQYLTRRYGLNARDVHWEPGEMPSEAMWSELEKLRQQHPARWMIWEGPPLPEIESRLEQQGVRSVVFAPCGNVPPSGDLLSVMRQNVENLRPVFGAK